MKRVVHILIIIIFFLSVTHSQDLIEKTLNGSLQKAELKANDKVVSIFDVSKSLKSSEYSEYIDQAVFLDIDAKELKRVLKSDDSQIIMEIPVSVGKSFNLILNEVDILAPGYYAETSEGRIIYPDRSKIKFYRGKVENDQSSVASITIINDQIRGLISDKNGDYNLGLFENQKSLYTLFNDKKLKSTNSFTCGTEDERHDINPNQLRPQKTNQKNNLSPCVPIYVEVDYQTYVDNSSSESLVESYVMSLIAEVAMIYDINTGDQNDPKSIAISLAKTFIWTTSDPYSSTNSTGIILDQFGKRLLDGDSTPGDGRLCHLISTRPIFSGVAWLNALCSDFVQWCWYDCGGFTRNGAATCGANWSGCSQRSPIDYAYPGPAAVSYGLGNVTPFPTYSWTVEVFAHEMGHNMGSPHTHSCSWTGGAIDNCWYTEGNCGYGPDPGASGGTIMSYCHLGASSGAPNTPNPGINLSNGFGPIPGQHIYDIYADAAHDDTQNDPFDFYCLLECTSSDIEGCTNSGACNYDNTATIDNGSCEFLTCAGCTNSGACNYDDTATIDDGSCEFLTCAGCTNSGACNYDDTATIDDGSCEFLTCAGCTNSGACNYDNTATIDDGSCEFLTCAGCTEVFATNYDPTKTINDGSCFYNCDDLNTVITHGIANDTIITSAPMLSTSGTITVNYTDPLLWRATNSVEINANTTIESELTIDVGPCIEDN